MTSFSSFALQFSNFTTTSLLNTGAELLIVEAGVTSTAGTASLPATDLAYLAATGRTVVGYVNTSVTDHNRAYWQSAWVTPQGDEPDVGTITATAPDWLKNNLGPVDFAPEPEGQPAAAEAMLVNYRDPAWRALVVAEAVAVVNAGFHGVFLDDVGRYFEAGYAGGSYDPTLADSMMQLVIEVATAIRAIDPDAKVIVNSGVNIGGDSSAGSAGALFAAYKAALNGVLIENQFAAEANPALPNVLSQAVASFAGVDILALENRAAGVDVGALLQFAGTTGLLAYVTPDEAYDGFARAPQLGGADGDYLVGGDGLSNLIAGLGGSDFLVGADQADEIYGHSGNDHLTGMGGADLLLGGADNDLIYGGDGNDTLRGGVGNDYLSDSTGRNWLEGEAGNDRLIGGSDQDGLFGGDGSDQISGKDGADWIESAAGSDDLDGGAGADTIWAGDDADWLSGWADNDVLYGEAGNDSLYGGFGEDRLRGGLGNDALNGEGGNDRLEGDDGNDDLDGGVGADQLSGSAGADYLTGAAGNDLITGGVGSDTLLGGDGADTLEGGTAADVLEGGTGDDRLSGDLGRDRLVGGAGSDQLRGGADKDDMQGNAGNDRIFGGLGDDTLSGGLGKDVLAGDSGNDRLTGGKGADVFVFDLQSGKDTVIDFNGAVDQIDLSALDVRFTQLRAAVAVDTFGLSLNLTALGGNGKLLLLGLDAREDLVRDDFIL